MTALLVLFCGLVALSPASAHADSLADGTEGSRIATSNIASDWDALPAYRHEGISSKRLAVTLAGVAVYDLAFYQTLKKPWWSGTRSDFHVINDWWDGYAMEVDKTAHAYAGQCMARIAAESYQWSGMSRRQSLFWGGVTGLATLSQVEVLDGYTQKYGFSSADYAANVIGAFFPLAQEMWSPLRSVTFKMSYHTKRFEQHSNADNILEDYDRQTYWLAFDLGRVLPGSVGQCIPSWLGLAVGYGVDNAFAKAGRIREYYVALDIDPTRANLGNGTVARLMAPLRYIHLPSPAFRIRADGTKFFALYF